MALLFFQWENFLSDHLQVNQAETEDKANDTIHLSTESCHSKGKRDGDSLRHRHNNAVTLEVDGKVHLTKITAPRDSSFLVNELTFLTGPSLGMLTHCSSVDPSHLSVTSLDVGKRSVHNLKQEQAGEVASWCKGLSFPRASPWRTLSFQGRESEIQGKGAWRTLTTNVSYFPMSWRWRWDCRARQGETSYNYIFILASPLSPPPPLLPQP